MAIVDNKSLGFVTSWGGGPLDFQAWKTEKLADGSFEYHAFVSVNENIPRIRSKGAPFMIIRITTPNEINSIQEYFMGLTDFEAVDDFLTLSWAGRTGLVYKRYDEVIKEFFQ